VTQTPSFSDVNLDGIQPPPPATELPLAPPVPRTGPPASEIAERSGITHLRYVGLAMADYERALRFYERVWGLYRIADDGNVAFLGAVGSPEPFILRIRVAADSRTDMIAFGARDAAAVDELAARLGAGGVRLVREPGKLASPGGGYGLRFFDPEGRVIEVSADVGAKPYRELRARESVPKKISHVVINSPDVPGLMAFYERHLGFRLSDWLADRMCFLRCSAEHHNLAIAHGNVPGLNHVSFEMRGIEEYLRGTGRLIRAGYRPLWGPGRHSAGDNTYAYFADPDRNVVEYTTELELVTDEDAWVPRVWSMDNVYADRWGTGGTGADLFALAAEVRADVGLWNAPPI
jgi:catechol 2,3-dioxygenase-like lactoylglutathione lyase family enzyme